MIKITPFSNILVGKHVTVFAKMNEDTFDFIIDVLSDLGYTIEEVEDTFIKKALVTTYEINPVSSNLQGSELLYTSMTQQEYRMLKEILPHLSYSITTK